MGDQGRLLGGGDSGAACGRTRRSSLGIYRRMKQRGHSRQKGTMCMWELGGLESHLRSAWLEVSRATGAGELGDAAGSGGQGLLMKGLAYLAMEFRLCPVKRWGPGECFELRNDSLLCGVCCAGSAVRSFLGAWPWLTDGGVGPALGGQGLFLVQL